MKINSDFKGEISRIQGNPSQMDQIYRGQHIYKNICILVLSVLVLVKRKLVNVFDSSMMHALIPHFISQSEELP